MNTLIAFLWLRRIHKPKGEAVDLDRKQSHLNVTKHMILERGDHFVPLLPRTIPDYFLAFCCRASEPCFRLPVPPIPGKSVEDRIPSLLLFPIFRNRGW